MLRLLLTIEERGNGRSCHTCFQCINHPSFSSSSSFINTSRVQCIYSYVQSVHATSNDSVWIFSMFLINSPPVAPPPVDSHPNLSGPAPIHASRRGMTAAELYSNRLRHCFEITSSSRISSCYDFSCCRTSVCSSSNLSRTSLIE